MIYCKLGKTLAVGLCLLGLVDLSASAKPLSHKRLLAESNYQAEDLELSGIVRETNGQAAIGATIRVQGTQIGTVSDAHGRFTLKVKSATGVLEISMVGFETVVIPYSTKKSLSIKLKEHSQVLDAVSVVAYGKKSTKDMVGSVASVKASQLENTASPTIDNLLQGKMSGVRVSQVGSPGGASKVVIRGYNSLVDQAGSGNDGSPLYVIDGVPVRQSAVGEMGGNILAGLDPSTIESVEVLKDAASAALYGSRASNGVIMVTTKKGKSGKPQFLVSFSQSFSYLPETPLQVVGKVERDFMLRLAKAQIIPDFDLESYKIINPKGYADTWGWATTGGGIYDYLWGNGSTDPSRIPQSVTDSLNSFYNNQTNWWKYMFRVGRVTKADVHASGGNDNIRYLVGAGAYDEKGIMLGSSFRRASLLNNLDIKFSPKMDMYTRLSLSYTDRAAGADNGLVQGLTIDPKTASTLLPGKGSIAETQAMARLRDIKIKNNAYNVRANLGLNYEPLKHLRLNISAAVDHHVMKNNKFTPDYLTDLKMPRSEYQVRMLTLMQSENILSYKWDIGRNHHFDAMAGLSFTRELMEAYDGGANGGPSNSVYYISDNWPLTWKDESGTVLAMQRVGSNYEEQAMVSYLGRLSYNYAQKYLAEFSIRRDGSSVFGRDRRWGTFPAVGVAWTFSSEKFLRNLWWLSYGKLRFSWGQSGQKLDRAYFAQGVMSDGNIFLGTPSFVPSVTANTRMSWEQTDQYDLGLDLNLLSHKLRIKLDYYYKYSSNLLMQVPLPGNVYYLQDAWDNVGAISNEGIELEIFAEIIKTKDFSWEASINASRNWNLFRRSYQNRDLNGRIVGRPTFGIYTYKDEGIIQSEADIPYYYSPLGEKTPLYFGVTNYQIGLGARKIKDFDNDGRIDHNDKYYAGSTLPLVYGGINTQLRWRDWSLDLSLGYSLGGKMMNMARNGSFAFSGLFPVLLEDPRTKTFWEKPGDMSDYPAMRYSNTAFVGQYDGDIDSNIETVNYLRLRQLSLAYKLPTSFVAKLGIKEMKLFLTGENLFLLSNYSGLDPEVVSPYTGKDSGEQYPLDRSITMGINIKF